jgi:hypothetical protein
MTAGIKHCRSCVHWRWTSAHRGNCKKHRWPKDQWSQSATAGSCKDYKPK